MNETLLMEEYRFRFEHYLTPLAGQIESHLKDRIEHSRIDLIRSRPKSPQSFLLKSQKIDDNGQLKYSDPLNQIHDQIGARIVTYYRTDIEPISAIINEFYASIEEQLIVPDSEKEFDYEGKHFILLIPEALITTDIDRNRCPPFFELQLKTLFQHAWAQADHNIAYKPSTDLTKQQKRIVACASAQAWGADHFFKILADELGVE
jgi:putative GTP pyrophosphokinase